MGTVLEAGEITKIHRMGEVDVHAPRGVDAALVVHPSDRLTDGAAVEPRAR